jgi:hypothetical protein
LYANIRLYRGDRRLMAALLHHENNAERVRLIEALGPQAYYVVRTPEGATSVSVFEDQTAAELANEAMSGWIRVNLPEQFDALRPDVTMGEVVYSSVLPQSAEPAAPGPAGQASGRREVARPV